jgi:hypothetical protein
MPRSVSKILEDDFLGIRCRLIELAAALDRIDRAEGAPADDPRIAQVRRSLEILADDAPGRTERVQMEFSLPHNENWRPPQ